MINKTFYIIACLNFCFGLLTAIGADTSGVLMITQATTNSAALRKLVYYSSDSQREVATVSYHIQYGADEANIVILQTPCNDLKPGVRLLVIDRKNWDVVVDTNISGVNLGTLMLINAPVLVVKSQQSLVYCSTFDGNDRSFIAINWKTGSVRQLNFGTLEQRRGLSPVLTGTPDGFATEYYRIAKHSVIVLYNTTTDQAELKMANIKGGANPLLSVPNFGLIEYESGWTNIYQLTDQTFSIALLCPPEISNLKINGAIAVRTIDGRPCLIWCESDTNANPRQPLISNIVFYDLISEVVLSRIPISDHVGTMFIPDKSGDTIYFVNPDTGSIISLDRKSGKVSHFAETGLHGFGEWNGPHIIDAN